MDVCTARTPPLPLPPPVVVIHLEKKGSRLLFLWKRKNDKDEGWPPNTVRIHLSLFSRFFVKKSNDFRPSQSQSQRRRRRMKSCCVGSCCLEPFNMSIVCVVLYFLLCVLRQPKAAAAAAPPSIHPSTAYYPSLDGRGEEKRVVMVVVLSKDHVKISCCLWVAGDMWVGWWGVMTLNLTGSPPSDYFHLFCLW